MDDQAGAGRERGKGHRCRMTVVVVDAVGDEGELRGGGVQQPGRAARARSVVSDFQDVDRPEQAALQQATLDRRLGVTGQQRAERAETQHADHRGVVDVVVGKRPGGIGRGGIEQGERRLTQPVSLAGTGGDEAPARFGSGERDESVVGGIVKGAAGVEDEPDLETMQHLHQAGNVILVRVGQQDDVDASAIERQELSQAAQDEVGIRAAVDQQRPTVAALDQDGVSLPHVEHDQVQSTVRQRGERDGQQRDDGQDRQGRQAKEPMDQAHQARRAAIPTACLRRQGDGLGFRLA